MCQCCLVHFHRSEHTGAGNVRQEFAGNVWIWFTKAWLPLFLHMHPGVPRVMSSIHQG